jgi:hypothetical protein
MMRYIKKSISLSSSPPVSDGVLEERAEDWTEVLFDIVPESYLADAFQLAAQNHESNFPISAFEVKAAFDQIYREEQKRFRQENFERALELETEIHSPNFEPCVICYGCGFAPTSRTDDTGKSYSGVIKCYSCNYWELYRKKHGL